MVLYMFVTTFPELTTMEEGLMLPDGKVYTIGQIFQSFYQHKLHQKYKTWDVDPDPYMEHVEVYLIT